MTSRDDDNILIDVKRCLDDCVQKVQDLLERNHDYYDLVKSYETYNDARYALSSHRFHCRNTRKFEKCDETVETDRKDEVCSSLFSWERYFHTTRTFPVNSNSFWHVEQSLSNTDFGTGQLIALISKVPKTDLSSDDPTCSVTISTESFYWPAKIVQVCGKWLGLSPFGADPGEAAAIWRQVDEDDSAENRINNFVCSIHCAKRRKWHSRPPEDVCMRNLPPDCALETYLKSNEWVSETAFKYFTSTVQYERIKIGQFVDVQDLTDPRHFWVCEILNNVGGRLLLKYVSNNSESVSKCFWEFYLSERIHPAGSARKKQHRLKYGWKYVNPKGVKVDADVKSRIKAAVSNSIPEILFQNRKPLKKHNFEINMKLESLHHVTKTQFVPANIVETLNDFYFVIEYDLGLTDANGSGATNFTNSSDAIRRICHKESPGLFPVGWCAQRRLRLACAEEFDWSSYLKRKGGKMAHEYHFEQDNSPNTFHRGHKLEAVNPMSDNQICVATVVRYVRPLIWIHLDGLTQFTVPFAIHCASTNLFPCGWSGSVGHPLTAQDFLNAESANDRLIDRVNAQFLTCEQKTAEIPPLSYLPYYFMPKYGCQWSPAIYFNPQCYIGPYICRAKLSEMPARVGPGPLHFVLKNVLRYLISSAYRPRDLFAEFQPDPLQPSNQDREIVEIKAKYRAKRWRGSGEICRRIEQVEDWCLQLCNLIDACPSLVSLKCVSSAQQCVHQCFKETKIKHSGILKCLSILAAKKLDKRLKSRRRQHPFTLIRGEPLVKRRRLLKQRRTAATGGPSTSTSLTIRQRPVTRGATLPKFEFAQKRPRRLLENFGFDDSIDDVIKIANGSSVVNGSSIESNKMDIPALNTLNATNDDDQIAFESIVDLSPSIHDDTTIRRIRASQLLLNVPLIHSNPLEWSPETLYQWILKTDLCKQVATKLKDELVDGQAFMLLTLPDVQHFLGMKLGPALKLCAVIKQLKINYLSEYANEADGDSNAV